jgi:shikimate kinase
MNVPRLFLVGYRGTGKSVVGGHLADALGWVITDADAVVKAVAGQTIADIFRNEGEVGFRERESAVLAMLCEAENTVVATGGGVVLRPANRALLRRSGYVAWLTASPETIWNRLQVDPATAADRPNLTAAGGLQEVRDLLAVREPLYREVATAAFPTDGRSPEEVADAILAAWKRS